MDMRLLAAANQVSTEPLEQIALIAMHTADEEPRVVDRAWASWRALPASVVAEVLVHAETPEPLVVWMTRHAGIAGIETGAESSRGLEERRSEGTEEEEGRNGGGEGREEEERRKGGAEEAEESNDDDDDVRRVSSLPVPAKIKMAMLGTREQRAILVRDPNRVVSTAVLSSPKLSDTEIEQFARMTNVAADVLRVIGTNRAWLRHYTIVSALVRNPRTPPAISLGLVARLQERELKALTVDRNVPEALRLASRKALATRESRRG